MTTNEKTIWLLKYGYLIGLREILETKFVNFPDGLKERMAEYKGTWMIFDPNDDSDGFCLVSDNLSSLIDEAYELLYEWEDEENA